LKKCLLADQKEDEQQQQQQQQLQHRSKQQKKTKSSSTQPLSKQLETDLRSAFALFAQQNKSDSIEAHELESVIVSLGIKLSNSELQSIMESANLDGHNKINCDQFIALITNIHLPDKLTQNNQKQKSSSSTSLSKEKNQLLNSFDLFSHGKEYITFEDLQRVAAELGNDHNLSLQDLQEMIREASGGSGKVSKQAFENIMNKKITPDDFAL